MLEAKYFSSFFLQLPKALKIEVYFFGTFVAIYKNVDVNDSICKRKKNELKKGAEMNKINVYSEIGKLKKVMIHRPGDEIDGVIPQTMPRHLFDDIPWKRGAQYEHDFFANLLRGEGAEVVYIEDLFRQSFVKDGSSEEFIERFLDKHKIFNQHLRAQLSEYLLSLDKGVMADKIIAGVRM